MVYTVVLLARLGISCLAAQENKMDIGSNRIWKMYCVCRGEEGISGNQQKASTVDILCSYVAINTSYWVNTNEWKSAY